MKSFRNAFIVSAIVFPALLSGFLMTVFADEMPVDQNQDVRPGQIGTGINTVKGETIDEKVIVNGKAEGDTWIFDFDLKDNRKVAFNTVQACKIVRELILVPNKPFKGQLKVSFSDQNKSGVQLDRNLGFCKFEKVGFSDDDINSLEWTLVANRDEVSAKGFDKNAIAMTVFQGGKWENVSTERKGGDLDGYVYSAKTYKLDFEYMTLTSVEKAGRNLWLIAGMVCGVILLFVVIAILMMVLGRKKNGSK